MDVPPVAHFSSVGKPYDEEQDIIVSQLTSTWYRIPEADVPPGWSNDWENWRRRWAWQGRPWPGVPGVSNTHFVSWAGQILFFTPTKSLSVEPVVYTSFGT